MISKNKRTESTLMVRNFIELSFAAIITLLITFNYSSAQLRLDIREVEDGKSYTVSPWLYPTMQARIRAELNGETVVLSKNNLLIVENSKASRPFYVGELKDDTTTSDRWQLIKWITKSPGPPPMGCGIYAFYEREIAMAAGRHTRRDLSFVKFFNYKFEPLIEMKFENVPAGESEVENIILKAMKGMIDGSGSEGQIWLDSVKVAGEAFRMRWDGWVQDRREPPLHIWTGMPYFVRLYYEPQNQEYHTGKLTAYYDRGLKQEVNLIGNEFHISEEANRLKVLTPNGGESFSPCEEVEIKWEGYIKGMGTIVEFSPNGGAYWNEIGISDDSTIKWTTPNVKANQALIRVRQKFSSTDPRLLREDNIPVRKIAFNRDGSRLLAANDAGVVRFWNTVDYESIKDYKISSPDYPAKRYRAFGLDYTEGDSVFAVVYKRDDGFSSGDSIAFFHLDDELPYQIFALDLDFNVQYAEFDSEKRYVALVPQNAMLIKIFSAKNGEFVRDLEFPYPPTAFSFSRDTNLAAAALMNGEIRLISTPDFETVETFDYSDFPIINEISLAPNGEFLAVACKAPQMKVFTDNKPNIYVVNLPTNQIIRRIKETTSDPIGLEFSPASTKVLVGSEADPQIAYWNLPVDEVFKHFKGHDGELTDFAFSPLGSAIATSSASSDNLYIRRFTYAESDESDSTFTIARPKIESSEIIIPPAFIAENKDYDFESAFCLTDSSRTFFKVNDIRLSEGVHFRLKEPLPLDTILMPSGCLPIGLNYIPLDTGVIRDTVIIVFCGKEYKVPIKSEGLPRNLEMVTNPMEFEKTCVGETKDGEFPFLVNADPVPVLINKLKIVEESSPFMALNNENELYQPEDTIFAKIRFQPNSIGQFSDSLSLTHSNIPKFEVIGTVKGEGIGTEYEVSHNDLRFIPEIPERTIKIRNQSENAISIEEVEIQPPDYFYYTSSLPIELPPLDSGELKIRWRESQGEPESDSKMTIIAAPCAARKIVTLGMYEAYSNIDVKDVYADPRNKTEIRIEYENDAAKPYNGERFFEGEIILNPRLFYPEMIKCPYGEGELLKNVVESDRRIIGFRTAGNFPESGTAAVIKGVAGLAETDSSHINLLPNAKYWGVSSRTNLGYGVFNLINICGDRLLERSGELSFLSVAPNPGERTFEIKFNASKAGKCKIEMFDNLGGIVYQSEEFETAKGANVKSIDIGEVKSGVYTVRLRQGLSVVSKKIIILD